MVLPALIPLVLPLLAGLGLGSIFAPKSAEVNVNANSPGAGAGMGGVEKYVPWIIIATVGLAAIYFLFVRKK